MDTNIENTFVKNFVVKNLQDRLIFELGGKKRIDGILRFCHRTEEIIKKEKIIASGKKLNKEEITKIVSKYNIADKWYVISLFDEYDGKYYKLNDALNLVLSNGMGAIILSEKTAIIETEQTAGAPMRYILNK